MKTADNEREIQLCFIYATLTVRICVNTQVRFETSVTNMKRNATCIVVINEKYAVQ